MANHYGIRGTTTFKTVEMKCKCGRIIGFMTSKYRGNYEAMCPSCYFDGWKNQK